MKRMVFVLVLASSFGIRPYAQDILSVDDEDMVKVSYGMWSGYSLDYRGERYGYGWGLRQPIRDVLRSDPEVLPFVDAYGRKIIIGNVLVWAGIAGFVTAPVFLTHDVFSEDHGAYDGGSVGLGVSAFLFTNAAALIAEVAGILFIRSSYENLITGVNVYNRNVARR